MPNSTFRTRQISLTSLSSNPHVAEEERVALASGRDHEVTYWWRDVGIQTLYVDYRTAQAFERVYTIAVRDTQANVCKALGLTSA